MPTTDNYSWSLPDHIDNLPEQWRIFKQIDADLFGVAPPGAVALADPGSNGILVRTALGTTTARTLAAPAAGLTIADPSGVAGNPTFALANDLAAIEALSGTGLAKRTGADAWSVGSIDLSTSDVSGVLADARFPATLPALSGVNLTALNASNLASGTISDARFPATLPAASGVNLTALNASNLASGTIPVARLGTTLAPQFARLGLGVAADSAIPLLVSKPTSGVFDVTTIAAIFGGLAAGDNAYFTGNTLNTGYVGDLDTFTLWMNYTGHAGGVTRFRNFIIADGKKDPILSVTGSSKAAVFAGAVSATNLSGTNTGDQSLAGLQPLDSDLTMIAGLTATTDNFIVSVASAWASRTPAQVKTTLSLNNVENMALSTWAGSSNITTVGTLTGGATGAGFTVALSTSTITGTLADARLSSNVALEDALNAFTAYQTILRAAHVGSGGADQSLKVENTVNSGTAGNAVSGYFKTIADGSAAINVGAAGMLNYVAGVVAIGWADDTATVPWVFGLHAQASNHNSTGNTVNNLAAIWADADVPRLTDVAYGILVTASNGVAATDAYGIRIDGVANNTAGHNWGVYVSGAWPNFFAGSVYSPTLKTANLISPDASTLLTIGQNSNTVTTQLGGYSANGLSSALVAAIAATGRFLFADNPANGDTITVNGGVFTFVTGASTSTDIHIEATLDDTLTGAAQVLNSSVNASVNIATYTNNVGEEIIVTHDTPGTGGNSFTLAESGADISVTGATLTGGAAVTGKTILGDWNNKTNSTKATIDDTLKTFAILAVNGMTLNGVPITAGIPTAITVANEATDTTCFPLFVTAATGDLGPKSNAGLSFNSSTSILSATGFSGPLTGNVTGNATGSSGSCTGNAATVTTNANLTGHITSVGNAAILGSFTLAQLNTAVSDANLPTNSAGANVIPKSNGPNLVASQIQDDGTDVIVNTSGGIQTFSSGAFFVTAQSIVMVGGAAGDGGLSVTGGVTSIGDTQGSGNATTLDVNDSAQTITASALLIGTTVQANTGFVPDANDGAYLGTSALGFSDLFLAEGGVINWDNGDFTITQAGNLLTFAGGEIALTDNLSVSKNIAGAAKLIFSNTNAAGFAALYFNGDLGGSTGGFLQWNNTTGAENLFLGTATTKPLYLGYNNGITATVQAGIQVGAPTGGDKGVGTLNAVAVYDDNVLLTDWVFDLHYDGKARADDTFYRGQQLYSLDATRLITETERRLPWMPDRKSFETERSLGKMTSRLWQGQEQQQIYIFKLEERIRQLNSKLEYHGIF